MGKGESEEKKNIQAADRLANPKNLSKDNKAVVS